MNMHQQWLKALDGGTDKVAENIRYAMIYSDSWEKLDFMEKSRCSSIANALARILTMGPSEAGEAWACISLLAGQAAHQCHRPADVAAALEQAAGLVPPEVGAEMLSTAKKVRRQQKSKLR